MARVAPGHLVAQGNLTGLAHTEVPASRPEPLISHTKRQPLFSNIAAAMQGVPEEIKRRQIGLFAKCDPAYGAGVANAVKLKPTL